MAQKVYCCNNCGTPVHFEWQDMYKQKNTNSRYYCSVQCAKEDMTLSDEVFNQHTIQLVSVHEIISAIESDRLDGIRERSKQ